MGDRARACLAAMAALLLAASLPASAQSPTRALIQSGPAASEEPPHAEALHEWWFFTVQNPRPSPGCGPWQAMVSFVSDREAVHDQLLFTAVVGGVAYEFSEELSPGSLSRSHEYGVTSLRLGGSTARGAHPAWAVGARTAGARLALSLDAGTQPLWRRRAPEGWGVLEITFAIRAAARGTLRIGNRVCRTTGATGYAEHVWGNWSRVPMWGVDYLNAHLGGGWSVYARHTPMRGELSVYARLGQDPEESWPPVMIVSDGRRAFEASDVDFVMTAGRETHPDLGVPVPASYRVVGAGFPPSSGIRRATLSVTHVSLATIFFETTSSGVLEGWGAGALRLEGARAASLRGTSEVEFQRFGTTFPN